MISQLEEGPDPNQDTEDTPVDAAPVSAPRPRFPNTNPRYSRRAPAVRPPHVHHSSTPSADGISSATPLGDSPSAAEIPGDVVPPGGLPAVQLPRVRQSRDRKINYWLREDAATAARNAVSATGGAVDERQTGASDADAGADANNGEEVFQDPHATEASEGGASQDPNGAVGGGGNGIDDVDVVVAGLQGLMVGAGSTAFCDDEGVVEAAAASGELHMSDESLQQPVLEACP